MVRTSTALAVEAIGRQPAEGILYEMERAIMGLRSLNDLDEPTLVADLILCVVDPTFRREWIVQSYAEGP